VGPSARRRLKSLLARKRLPGEREAAQRRSGSRSEEAWCGCDSCGAVVARALVADTVRAVKVKEAHTHADEPAPVRRGD
jgi:hypothetical protein